MTVSSQETVFHHVGNGVTVTFAYGCQVPTANDLNVYVDDVLTPTGFTIAGIGSPSGGSITFAVAPANLVAVRIEREIEIERTTDYQQNGDFLSRVVNPDFDRLWMAMQQQFSGVRRALKVPKSDSTPPADLPSIADRANKLLSFDSSGNPIAIVASAQSATALALALAGPSGGLGLVSYLAQGAGAALRSAQDKLRDLPANAADYGVLPNSGVDVWAGLNSAMLNHRVVQLEEGVYLVSRGLRQTLNGAVLRGRGKGKTIIRAMSPTGDGDFGGTDGNEAVVWAQGGVGAPLFGLGTEDLSIDCAGLMTGLPSGDVFLKGHHYRRVFDFRVNCVDVKECGSYAFWANDKAIDDGGTITGCGGEYNDCAVYDSEISFETTGRCFVTYNRPRVEQTRALWDWPILEQYHFYGGDGLITVNDGYALCSASTIIGPSLTQKNVVFNGGYFEQLNAATTVINMAGVNAVYDNWCFNDVTMIGAGTVGPISFGDMCTVDAKMTFKGGRYVGLDGSGPTFTATIPNYGSIDMIGVDCQSTTTGGAVPFSLIVAGTFKNFSVVGGNQEAYGPAVGASPVNAASARFSSTRMFPTSSVTETIRQTKRGSSAFADGGGFGQINLAMPLNLANKAKVVVVGSVEATTTDAAGAAQAVAYSWTHPGTNIMNILAPVGAVGRTFNYLITEFE